MLATDAVEKMGPAIGVAADPTPDPVAIGKAMEAELLEQLRSRTKLWNDFQTHMVDGVWYTDPSNLSNEWLSPRFWRTLGYDPEEMARKPQAWSDIADPGDLAEAFENLERHYADPERPFDQVIRYRCADGGTAWIRCRGYALRDDDGRPVRVLGTFTDVTQLVGMTEALKNAREAQRRTEQRLWSAIDAIPDALAIYDAEDRLVICNDQYRQLYSQSASAITVGATFEEILRAGLTNGQYPEAAGREEAWLAERLDRHRNPTGPIEQELPGDRHLQIHEVRTTYGDTVGLRVEVTDLRRRQRQLEEYAEALKKAATELEKQAQEDLLTGLANRRHLENILPARTVLWTRTHCGVALMLIDLDLFKSVNDSLGHAAGDHVLVEVARILKEEIRSEDIASRIGGDEFLIATPYHGKPEALLRFARRLIDRLGAPMTFEGSPIEIGASIGISICEDGATRFKQLLGIADRALYEAKAAGRNQARLA